MKRIEFTAGVAAGLLIAGAFCACGEARGLPSALAAWFVQAAAGIAWALAFIMLARRTEAATQPSEQPKPAETLSVEEAPAQIKPIEARVTPPPTQPIPEPTPDQPARAEEPMDERSLYASTCARFAQAQLPWGFGARDALRRVRTAPDRLRQAELMLSRIRTHPSPPPADLQRYFAEDYDRLRRMPDIADIRVDPNAPAVTVITRTIYRSFQGRTFEIGDFEICIRPGVQPSVRNIRNTGARPDVDHPLVAKNAYCLGSILPMVQGAIGRGELAVAFTALILFLKEAEPMKMEMLHNWREVTTHVPKPQQVLYGPDRD
jgi:hypothetical protein